MRRHLLTCLTAPAFAILLVACVGGGSDVGNPGDDGDGGGVPPPTDASIAPSFDGGAPSFDAAVFDAGRDSAVTSGVFYGACLSELAFGQTQNVFNFIVDAKTSGQNLNLTFRALSVSNKMPPPTVSRSGAVGTQTNTQSTSAQGGVFPFVLQQTQMTIPGTANPISGTDVVIEGVTFNARWDDTRHCARLGGEILMPVAAARTLDPTQNICLFVQISEGQATPTFTAADFQASNCPP
jgi:hypothetical protein